MIIYNKNLKILSRELRRNSTKEEIILWNHIRNRQILNIRFYRQKPLNGYIVDFYAPKVNLIIELDGSQHYEPDNKEYDLIRSNILLSHGLTVKRYDNSNIKYELNSVLNDIYKHISDCF